MCHSVGLAFMRTAAKRAEATPWSLAANVWGSIHRWPFLAAALARAGEDLAIMLDAVWSTLSSTCLQLHRRG